MTTKTDRYENIRKALEGLRERCAQEAERITARRRAVAAMSNDEAVKPCEVAAAIRKIDMQQHYGCAVREIEQLRSILIDLKDWDCDVSGGFLSIPVGLRRRIQDALAAQHQEPTI